jgi:hypothetical protein
MFGEHDRRQHPVDLGLAAPRPGQELFDLVNDASGIAKKRSVFVTRELDISRAGHSRGQLSTAIDAYAPIAVTVQDQDRHPDRRQDIAHVDLVVHADQRRRRSRACTQTFPTGTGLHKLWIGRLTRCRPGRGCSSTPVLGVPVETGLKLLGRPPVGHVHREGCIEDQSLGPLRLGGGEQDAHGPALGLAEEGGAPRANCVHDCAHVVYSLFQRCYAKTAIRYPGPTLVEADQATE